MRQGRNDIRGVARKRSFWVARTTFAEWQEDFPNDSGDRLSRHLETKLEALCELLSISTV